MNKQITNEQIRIILFSIIFTVTSFFIIIFSPEKETIRKSYTETIIYSDKYPHEETIINKIDPNNIPPKYQYREVDINKLKAYLDKKNSFLASEPYISDIINAGKKYNINPCLLFAITGKEQSFIPKTHPYALKIANNPFNVFGSWQIYNTTTNDSAEIACKTIIKISKQRPYNAEFLKWLNLQNGTGGYAEDPLWHEGVGKIFENISLEV